MERYCLTLDLKDDPALIATYKQHHQRIWPEVRDHLHSMGVLEMEIYLLGTRMCMVMEVSDAFSFERMAAADRASPKIQEWEQFMSSFQQTLSGTPPGVKWIRMERIFQLSQQ